MSILADAPATAAVDSRPRGRTVVFGLVPALDGIRAVAVMGVMLYHGGAPLASGGFLGVNMFFVLSGFLITSLLMGEWARRLTIRLGQFWTRRARRLLPALLVMLVGVAVYARFFATPGEFAGLRLDALSTLFYVANWHFIESGSNYFAATAQPSPLSHMWSLAIEEQFYIVWPPVVLVLLRVGRRLRPSRRLWPVLTVAVAGALASAADMRWSFLHGASVTRLYEGTDTRCQDILVGAALAAAMAIWAQHRRPVPQAVPDLDYLEFTRIHPSAGTVGLGEPAAHRRDFQRKRGPSLKPITAWELSSSTARLAAQFFGWTALLGLVALWGRLDGPTGFLFGGGELLVAVAVAVVLFCIVTAQRGSLARALANPVFVYVGKISYGLYLWHFPLFSLLDAERMHLYGLPLLGARIGATVVVATASYYLVEQPIRRSRMATFAQWRGWLVTSGAFLGVVAVTVAATLPSAAQAAVPLSSSTSSSAEFSGPPVKVAILGDSVAWRLGFALMADQPQSTYDVDIDNGAIVACGVVRSTYYLSHGVPDLMAPACSSATPASGQWPALWKGNIDEFHPDVVVVLAGRWEVMDRQIDGRWTHIGEPLFDGVLQRSLEQAVRVASSDGAYVVLMTAPCFDSGEQPNGLSWPEDSATRLDLYNTMVRQIAAEHPANVQVEDFGGMVCPGGVFTSTLDGVQIRDGDGVHIVPTPAAGQWLSSHLLPQVVQVGRLQMAGQSLAPMSVTPTTGSAPVTVSASGSLASSGTRGP
ncbi:MAG: acyltransferase family protein [Acidimicrobiales bacterium]|jgi:peptidoglycan/LPS O-acetylase OafA/YrhL